MQLQDIKTPGVYVKEIPILAPSVAPVATAIPVFIGYTEKGPTLVPTRIDTLLDYENLFGGAYLSQPTVTVTENPAAGLPPILTYTPDSNATNFLMYYGLSLYFQNGGGSCYILSVGNYYNDKSKPSDLKKPFTDALGLLKQEDEPTLIVLLDATTLNNPSEPKFDYYDLCSQGLQQCSDLGDRFLLVDIPDGNKDYIRNNIGINNLSYGAAYFPYLKTTLNYRYDEKNVTISDNIATFAWSSDPNGFTVSYTGTATDSPSVTITADTTVASSGFDTGTTGTLAIKISSTNAPTAKALVAAWVAWKKNAGNDAKGFDIVNNGDGSATIASLDNKTLTNVTTPTLFSWSPDDKGITVSYVGAANETPDVVIQSGTGSDSSFDTSTKPGTLTITTPSSAPSSIELKQAWDTWQKKGNDPKGFGIVSNGDGTTKVTPTPPKSPQALSPVTNTLAIYKDRDTSLYNQIKNFLANQRVTLPPSPAIAGIYASVDRDRGVWKAPANVSLSGVIGPVTKISDTNQDDLNIDTKGGKSINAIRSFTGKGTLVWGARTLAGNDNEWRYVSVRRLFINIEESTRKASAFAVFEPNDATTWLKVKAMLESYLYGLWQQGALAGSKPESAYFVSVGLGKSMTAQDILEGRMIVNIGVAAVRPAEFIVLTFSHKMQEA